MQCRRRISLRAGAEDRGHRDGAIDRIAVAAAAAAAVGLAVAAAAAAAVGLAVAAASELPAGRACRDAAGAAATAV